MTIKNIIRLVALTVAGASMTSCDDTLDVNRTDVLSDAAMNSTTLELQLLEMVIAVSCVCV